MAIRRSSSGVQGHLLREARQRPRLHLVLARGSATSAPSGLSAIRLQRDDQDIGGLSIMLAAAVVRCERAVHSEKSCMGDVSRSPNSANAHSSSSSGFRRSFWPKFAGVFWELSR